MNKKRFEGVNLHGDSPVVYTVTLDRLLGLLSDEVESEE